MGGGTGGCLLACALMVGLAWADAFSSLSFRDEGVGMPAWRKEGVGFGGYLFG